MDSFRSVKTEKVSERIVQQIKDSILDGTMKAGDRLPAERELGGYFQASRVSIREAVKRLEASGLLRIKPGSGIFVAEINGKAISESLSSILRIQKTSMNAITEARLIFEPSIAKLACEKMTAEDLLKLEQNVQETTIVVKSNTLTPDQNIEFHSLIVESTHNPVITLTMNPILDVLKEMDLEIRDNLQKRAEISRNAVYYHKKILKAFQGKESQNVYELMMEHILEIQGSFKRLISKIK